MALLNGKWNIITSRLCPGSMRLRHFIPCAFVLSLIGMPILTLLWWAFGVLFGLELLAYLALDVFFSARAAEGAKEFLRLLYLFPLFHICYGWGSILGIFKVLFRNY